MDRWRYTEGGREERDEEREEKRQRYTERGSDIYMYTERERRG